MLSSHQNDLTLRSMRQPTHWWKLFTAGGLATRQTRHRPCGRPDSPACAISVPLRAVNYGGSVNLTV
jgi:hypothetical protein